MGNELKSLTHSIQVLGNEPEDFSLSSSVDHFIPGDDIKITASFERELSTYVFFDIHSRDGDIFDSKLASGNTLDFEFVAPDQLSPVSIDVYYMDDRGRIIKKFLVIMPDYDRLTVTVETDKEVYLPGDTAKVTVRVFDINGDPVDDAFVAITITDAAVFELVAGGNESTWFASMASQLNRYYLSTIGSSWSFNYWMPSTFLPLFSIAYTVFERIMVQEESSQARSCMYYDLDDGEILDYDGPLRIC